MIRTERLVLREWREEDRAPFVALNADPEVMRHFVSTHTRAESDAMVDRNIAHFGRHGFGLWAVEAAGEGFIGFTGLCVLREDEDLYPGVEIGWRLARGAWGKGYATEAARASLANGFGRVGLTKIVAYTARTNRPSENVMQRIGMVRDEARDFDHHGVPEGHALRPHIVYAARAGDWRP